MCLPMCDMLFFDTVGYAKKLETFLYFNLLVELWDVLISLRLSHFLLVVDITHALKMLESNYSRFHNILRASYVVWNLLMLAKV